MPPSTNGIMRAACCGGLMLGLACTASGAWASAELALEQGCFSCHGNPPRGKAPTFPELANKHARYQSEPGAEAKLADKLRKAPLFGGIDAHQRLSQEDAKVLLRWIIQGAR